MPSRLQQFFARALLLLGLGGAMLGFAPAAHAQTEWTGNKSAAWGTGTNWDGGAAPNSATANAEFGPATSSNITITGIADTVANITFNSSQAYVLSTGTLTMAPASGNATIGIGNTGSLTINAGLTLSKSLLITYTNTGTLTIAGTITATNEGIAVGGASAGKTVISSSFGGTGSMDMNASTGTLTLSGLNTYSGGTTLSTGTLVLNAGSSGNTTGSALGTGALTIAGGTIDSTVSGITLGTNNLQNWNASFTFTGTDSLNLGTGAVTLGGTDTVTITANTLTVGGAISGAHTLTKAGAGTLDLTGSNSYSGLTTISAGTLILAGLNTGAGGVTLTAGTLEINAGASANTTGSALGTGSLIITTGTIDNTSGGAITIGTNNAQYWNGSFTFTGSNALNLGTGAVTLGGTDTVTVSASTLTVGGVISGAHTLTKAGASGTLELDGSNSYTGLTTLNGGTLILTGMNTGAGGVTLTSGTLDINAGSSGNTTGSALGTGSLIITTGTIDNTSGSAVTVGTNNAQYWNGSFTFTGSNALNLGTGAVTLGGTDTVTVSASTLTVGGIISGAHTLATGGAGTLDLTGNNTYTGLTTVNTGTLILAGMNSGAGGVTVASGTLDINAGNSGNTTNSALGASTGRLTIDSGATIDNTSGGAVTIGTNNVQTWAGSYTFTGSDSLNLGTGAVTLSAADTVTVSANTLTVGGVISGAFALTTAGSGTLQLNGANTFTGAMTIGTGTLEVSVLAVEGTASGIGDQSTGAATNLVINGGTLAYIGSSAASVTNRLFTLGTAGGEMDADGTAAADTLTWGNATALTYTGTGARTFTLGGNNTGANTFAQVLANNTGLTSLTKTGVGEWILTGANTYTGVTTITGGILMATTLTAPGTAGSIGEATGLASNLIINGGTLAYTGTSAASITTRLFTLGATGEIDADGTTAANTLTWGNSSALTYSSGGTSIFTLGGNNTGANTFAQVLADGTGATSLVKTGAGEWVLTGLNTYSGGTTLSTGTLVLNAGSSGNSTGSAIGTGALTIDAGATIDSTVSGIVLGTNNLQDWDGSFTFLGTDSLNLGTGAVTLSAAPTVTVNANTLTVGGVISGAFALTKAGAGTLDLTGANTYTGATTINAGTLSVSTLANGGSASGVGESTSAATNLVLSGNAVLSYTGTGGTNNRLFSLGATGGEIDSSGTGALIFGNTGALAYSGTNLSTTLVLGGTNTGANDIALSIANNGTGTTSLEKVGTGTWSINGTNTYSGLTTVTAGILDVTGGSALGTNAAGTVVTSGATLQLDNGINVGNTTSTLTLSGTGVGGNGALLAGTGSNSWSSNITLGADATISSGSSSGTTFTLGVDDGNPLVVENNLALGTHNLTFIGGSNTISYVNYNITGTGGVIVNTSGTVQFEQYFNAYTGTTTVDLGTLIVDSEDQATPQASGNSALGIQGAVIIGQASGVAGSNSAVLQFSDNGAGGSNSNYIIGDDNAVTIEPNGELFLNGQDEQIGALTINGGYISTNGTTVNGFGGLFLNENVTVAANSNMVKIDGNITLGPANLGSQGNATVGFNVASGGNTTADLTVDAVVTGGGLYKTGAGTMVLNNNLNTYTGNTEVAQGVLNIQAANALGATGNGTVVDTGGQLQLQSAAGAGGGITYAAEPLTINGNGTASNGALENVNGNSIWTGPILVGAGNAAINTMGGSLVITSNVGVVSGTPTLTVNGTNNTTFSGNINGALSLNVTSTGTVTMNGTLANTYTGSTTVNSGTLALDKTGGTYPAAISGNTIIVNTGGTLLSQNSNQISSSTNMTLAGGEWNTNGYTEAANNGTRGVGLGTLTLTANSTLELGKTGGTADGTSLINFSQSTISSWTTGATLYILDWDGSLTGGVNTQIYFGSAGYNGLGSGSTPNQVFSDIIFEIQSGNPEGLAAGNYEATILSSGEIVPFLPTPEPGTVVAGAALGALAVLHELRRRKQARKTASTPVETV